MLLFLVLLFVIVSSCFLMVPLILQLVLLNGLVLDGLDWMDWMLLQFQLHYLIGWPWIDWNRQDAILITGLELNRCCYYCYCCLTWYDFCLVCITKNLADFWLLPITSSVRISYLNTESFILYSVCENRLFFLIWITLSLVVFCTIDVPRETTQRSM